MLLTPAIILIFSGCVSNNQSNNDKQEATDNQGIVSKCQFIVVNGAKILAEGKTDFKNANRGETYPILSFDLNQDGKADDIDYWLSTSIGQEKIMYATKDPNVKFGGDLLEEEFFTKQDDSQIWVMVVKSVKESLPLVLLWYKGSESDDPLASSLYIFKNVNGGLIESFKQKLDYGQNPDAIDFDKMIVEDAYGSGGFSTEYKLVLK